jgi:hypothetical protein
MEIKTKKITINELEGLLDLLDDRKRKSKWDLTTVKDGEPLLIEGARAGQVAGLRWRIKQKYPNLIILAKPIGTDQNIKESENKTVYRAVVMTKSDYEKAAQRKDIKVKGVKEITTK